MPERVRIDEQRGIIVIHSSGEVRTEDVQESMRELRRILTEKGIDRTLVDARQQRALPSTTEIFQLTADVPGGMRVALLVSPGLPTEEGMRFAETAAKNAGLEWKLFTDEDEAVAWLQA